MGGRGQTAEREGQRFSLLPWVVGSSPATVSSYRHGLHSDLRYGACEILAVLSTIEQAPAASMKPKLIAFPVPDGRSYLISFRARGRSDTENTTSCFEDPGSAPEYT